MEITGEKGMVVRRNGTRYKIDFSRVDSIESLIIVLKSMDIFFWIEDVNNVPEFMQEIFNSGLLTEVD